jgi:mono/diheme cytochrome c family protein
MRDFGFIQDAAADLAAFIVSQRQMRSSRAGSWGKQTGRSWCAFLVLAAILVRFTDALGADRIDRGRALLAQHCAGCHSIERTGPSPLAAAPAFRAIGDRLDIDQLFERIREGLSSAHKEMPTFRFDPEDARAISSYLSSIQQ